MRSFNTNTECSTTPWWLFIWVSDASREHGVGIEDHYCLHCSLCRTLKYWSALLCWVMIQILWHHLIWSLDGCIMQSACPPFVSCQRNLIYQLVLSSSSPWAAEKCGFAVLITPRPTMNQSCLMFHCLYFFIQIYHNSNPDIPVTPQWGEQPLHKLLWKFVQIFLSHSGLIAGDPLIVRWV